MATEKREPVLAANEDRWRALTWDDLDAWAGSRSLERGRTYQRSGRVRELARSAEGTLLAYVLGTERYVTRVDLGEDGRPIGRCTCPLMSSGCKHAVAV